MLDSRSSRDILISGGGIAGLTLGILLKEHGWNPLVIERAPAPQTGGYMMDFFGTGWDVAERMGLTDALRAVHYPIDTMRYVDERGVPYLTVPLDRFRRAMGGRYVYLLRSDLERILLDRAKQVGVDVRFGTSIESLRSAEGRVEVTFENDEQASVALLIGADGVHSRVRELAFGPEAMFARHLGCHVAAFHAPLVAEAERSLVLYEEVDRVAAFYPLSNERMDTMYLFRDTEEDSTTSGDRLWLLRRRFADAGWIASRVLEDLPDDAPLFFDALIQIQMPRWSSGRVCLVGDACGCLTLAAGQGSHMAMAGAYVLASELSRRPHEPLKAIDAYEAFFKPKVERKQAEARKFAARMVPDARSWNWLRRFAIRAMFSRILLPLTCRGMGSRSVLHSYHP
jgi:2-polyprenyl-6-methoxyphenol hydroxylase-like FAD-dependent oxidoreductase